MADEHTHNSSHTVHHVLAHSYLCYFFFFILAVVLDLVLPIRIWNGPAAVPVGIALIIFASLLIFWAQHTSRNLKKHNLTKKTFFGGPYTFSRSPTHWGLFFLMIGFGFMTNSFFIIIFALAALLITRIVFLRQEEIILLSKYGAPYLEYKKSVML